MSKKKSIPDRIPTAAEHGEDVEFYTVNGVPAALIGWIEAQQPAKAASPPPVKKA